LHRFVLSYGTEPAPISQIKGMLKEGVLNIFREIAFLLNL